MSAGTLQTNEIKWNEFQRQVLHLCFLCPSADRATEQPGWGESQPPDEETQRRLWQVRYESVYTTVHWAASVTPHPKFIQSWTDVQIQEPFFFCGTICIWRQDDKRTTYPQTLFSASESISAAETTTCDDAQGRAPTQHTVTPCWSHYKRETSTNVVFICSHKEFYVIQFHQFWTSGKLKQIFLRRSCSISSDVFPAAVGRKRSWRDRWIEGEQRRSTRRRPKRNIWLRSMSHKHRHSSVHLLKLCLDTSQ